MSDDVQPGNLANATLRLSMNGEKSPKLRNYGNALAGLVRNEAYPG